MSVIIETERLRLRNWKNKDTIPFTEMCADPRVMEYISTPHTPEGNTSDDSAESGIISENMVLACMPSKKRIRKVL